MIEAWNDEGYRGTLTADNRAEMAEHSSGTLNTLLGRRLALPKANDRLPLGKTGLTVSPFCFGRTASADTVVAAYEAGINFFFVTADLHWPFYDGIRRGLAKLLRGNPFSMIFELPVFATVCHSSNSLRFAFVRG